MWSMGERKSKKRNLQEIDKSFFLMDAGISEETLYDLENGFDNVNLPKNKRQKKPKIDRNSVATNISADIGTEKNNCTVGSPKLVDGMFFLNFLK